MIRTSNEMHMISCSNLCRSSDDHIKTIGDFIMQKIEHKIEKAGASGKFSIIMYDSWLEHVIEDYVEENNLCERYLSKENFYAICKYVCNFLESKGFRTHTALERPNPCFLMGEREGTGGWFTEIKW